MNYNQALDYIHSLNRFGIHPGLERIEALCRAVGNPQEKLKFVHVAGTNGKGSTSTMIAGALSASGKKTGLFTSPYVSEFLERICIDSKPVSRELFAECITEIEPVVSDLAEKNMQPTEFEVITAAAFMIFERAKCDICVLEVGLGGRLDSTNVIKAPLVSVIASVSLDHTAILGDTVEQIAHEKCGIIKPGCKTVCYPLQEKSVFEIINSHCVEKQNTVVIPDTAEIHNPVNKIDGAEFEYRGTAYKLSMSGEYQIFNAVTAIEACRLLGLDKSDIKRGVEQARVAARMEVISSSPLVLLDGGHNEDGGKQIASSLKTLLNNKKILAVIGMMADKNVDRYLSCVAELCECVVATTVADNPRAMPADELQAAAAHYCKNTLSFATAKEAVEYAAANAAAYDCLLVCGSLYLAGEVRAQLKKLF